MGSLRQPAVVLAALAGCYSPNPAAGIPCSPTQACPTGQHCDLDAPGGPTCIAKGGSPGSNGGDDGPADDPGTMSPDASPTPVGSANDLPGAARDVSAGGAFTYDLANAHDDTASPCAAGSVDLFFRITLAAPEVIYLDTFGSAANVAVAVRAGSCLTPGAVEACVDDSCGGKQVQGAWNLAAGDHCIVVEQADATGPSTGTLSVVRGTRAGDPLVGKSGTVSGDTCKDDNSNTAGCGCEPAQDHHYFFTVCPNTSGAARLETCDKADWDTVVQFRSAANAGLGCNDDSCGIQSELSRTISAPGLYWAIIDGCDDCGTYTMAYTLP